MKRAVFESDYAPGTTLFLLQTDDGDIIVKTRGDGEMRIATSGGKMHGRNLVDCVGGFAKAIDAINNAKTYENGVCVYRKPGDEERQEESAGALLKKLAEYENTELTPEEIGALKSSQWIYNPIDAPYSEFEQTIGAVEKALGFRLFVWQKTYIAQGKFRKMGATTAEILRDLLDVSGKPIDYSRRAESEREHFYRWELYRIKEKLDNAGIPTRTVFFSERDKRAYREKEG